MTSGLPEPAAPVGFLARWRNHERLLGAVVTADLFDAVGAAGLDVLAVTGPVSAGQLAALRRLPVAAVLLVESADAIGAAVTFGLEATIARAAVEGVDVVLTDRGPARMVRSPQDAAAAFASGARLVLYDLPAMLHDLIVELPSGRPPKANETAAVDGVPLGPRVPLVLLSGMLGDSSLWDDVAASLADVVLPWPVRIDRDDSVAEMAAGVLAEAPQRFVVVGHSLGAIVALEIARRAPQRLTGLVLINASARGPSEAQQAVWSQWRQRTADGEFAEIADELAAATIGESHRTPTLVARNRGMADTVGAAGFLRQLAAQGTRPDSRSAGLPADVPVLVVSGESDDICPPQLQRELSELVHGARMVTIADAGHMVPIEAPNALAGELRSWLRRSVPGRQRH